MTTEDNELWVTNVSSRIYSASAVTGSVTNDHFQSLVSSSTVGSLDLGARMQEADCYYRVLQKFIP